MDAALSEFYGYDALDRLTSMNRGSVNNPDYQSWGLDGVSNWLTSTTGSTTDTKTFDKANQTATTTASIPPTYDAAGNMTLTPKPGNAAAPISSYQSPLDSTTPTPSCADKRLSDVRGRGVR